MKTLIESFYDVDVGDYIATDYSDKAEVINKFESYGSYYIVTDNLTILSENDNDLLYKITE